MKACFVDTNLFIRYLTNDDPVKANKVEDLLNQAAAGKIRLVTAEIMLTEVVWVLASYYALKKDQISSMVKAILATPGLEVINGKLLEKAVDYYLYRNVDFIDAYIVALMEKLKISDIYSFDKKHLARINIA